MPSSPETALRLLLRRALTAFPTRQVRAIAVDIAAPSEPLAYQVTVYHHGPAAVDLMEKLKTAHAAVPVRFAPGTAPTARLTLKRWDRPRPIVPAGLPIFVQPGTVIVETSPVPRPEAPKLAGKSSRTLDELDPLSPAQLRRHQLSRSAALARRKPLARLSPAELLTLLHDGRGVRHLLPLAVTAARADPWADRGHHMGDLLMAVLHTPPGVCAPGTALHAQLVALATAALKAASRLPPAQRLPDLEDEIRRLLKRWHG